MQLFNQINGLPLNLDILLPNITIRHLLLLVITISTELAYRSTKFPDLTSILIIHIHSILFHVILSVFHTNLVCSVCFLQSIYLLIISNSSGLDLLDLRPNLVRSLILLFTFVILVYTFIILDSLIQQNL